MAYAYPQTTRTGQWACPTIESQTLPIRARRTLPRPLLPITISLFMVSDGTYDWVVYEKENSASSSWKTSKARGSS